MFRTNKASSFAASALRGTKCAVEAKGSSWSQTVGALVDGLERGCPQNQGWGIPEMGSASCGGWKGLGDPDKL